MIYNDSSDNERLGVAHCEKVFTKIGFIFREQPIRDYGIDAHIETKTVDYASGKLVAIQIKSGKSYFQESKDNFIIFRGENKHYDYWLKHSLPVMLVLYNPDNDDCIWEQINSRTIEKTSKGWKVKIPKDQKLESAGESIKRISENQTEYQKRLNTLLLAKPWMLELENGSRAILEAEEWINKTSGRGAFTLKIIDDVENENIVIEWPIAFFGLTNYETVFKKLFPWASLRIDSQYYEDYDHEDYETECGIYDSETKGYIGYHTDYSEWITRKPKIRPYSIVAGEVASYRLELTLNRLGKLFLEFDELLENDSFYIISEEDLQN